MAAILKLRRGTSNASPSLDESELYLHNGVGSIQFGSGSINNVITYTLLPLNAPVAGNINLIGNITASHILLSGDLTARDVRLSGNIFLGDSGSDNIIVTAQVSGSLIPSASNEYDLGSDIRKWKNLYAVSASIDSISVPGSGILSSSGISFDLYTGSVDTKNITLANVTASLISSASNIAISSSNIDNKFASLKIYTGSVDTYISASNLDLARIHESTSSLNIFSASVLLYTASINTYTSSINLDLARIHESTSSLNTFSASVLGHISDINTYTASINLDLARIHESTSSLNTFSASVLGHISDINTYTSSINLDLARIHESTASLNSYTQSLKDAITVSGSGVSSTTTIKGDLVVQGTTTAINSTTIQLGDNVIELNGTGVANGGLLVKDPTAASFISGSLLWDSTNDYWKGGKLNEESKILLAGGDGIVSSSAQVTSLLPPLVVSGSQQVIYSDISSIPPGIISSSTQILNYNVFATTGSNSFNGNQIISGNLYLTGSIIPAGSASFDLGSQDHPFRHLYASSGSIYMDGTRVIGAETRPVKIGDTHEGGIVFYIDSNSHCLIVDSEETGRAQSQYLQIATGATGTAIGTGQSNTNLIMARSGSASNSFSVGNSGLDGEDPAYVCHNLTKGGFSDWFLPSVDEMKQVGVAIPSLIYQGFVEERYHWTSTINLQGSGQPYSYYTVDGSGRTGRPLRDPQNGGYAQIPFRAIRRSTNLTVVGGLTLLTNTTYSGSITTLDGLVNGVNISASFDLTNERLTELESSSLNLNIVSSSLNNYTASASGRLNNIEAATSSYETKGRSIVSGSSQITYSDISSISVGIVSGSSQVTPLLPTGSVSGSSQVIYTSLSSIPAGIVSGSLQIPSLLPTGVVSGSNQLSSSYNLLYAPSASFATLLGANPLSSLGSAAFYYVTSSDYVALVSGSITYTNNHLLTAGATKKYIDWRTDEILIAIGAADITAVNAGNGLSGGGISGDVTLTLDTGSTHFTNGVDARLIPLTSLNSYTGSQNTKNSTLATYTASIDSHISNLNQATSSYETKGRGIVSGSSQITFSGISSLPTLVSGSSQITYASISSIPAGIVSGSSQLSGTTITDLTIVNLTTINETASVIFSSGSNRFGDFGNDTHSFTGSVQISGSLTTIGDVTATSFNGVINATNGVISGSSQLTATLPSGVVSSSLQVTKTLQEVTTAGASTSTAITITNATASTTKTTGALIVTGGIGVSGDINAGGDIVAFSSSDIRLKNNIRPIESPLEKISKISGCEFDWNVDLQSIYSGKDYGVIAQEIEEVFPELVQTRENGYKAVKYDKLVSVLIEGIKELTKQVEYLKTKIEN